MPEALNSRMRARLQLVAGAGVDPLARKSDPTYRALQRRGLVRFAAWPDFILKGLRKPVWQITDAGRAALASL